MFCDFFFKFLICIMICQTPRKNLDCKIQITINRNFNLRFFIFFLVPGNVSNPDYPVSW